MAWKVVVNQPWNNPGAADVIIYREAGGDKIQVLYIEDTKTRTMSVKEFSANAVVVERAGVGRGFCVPHEPLVGRVIVGGSLCTVNQK